MLLQLAQDEGFKAEWLLVGFFIFLSLVLMGFFFRVRLWHKQLKLSFLTVMVVRQIIR